MLLPGRRLIAFSLLALGLVCAVAAEAADSKDQAVLEGVVKDLGITLSEPDQPALRVPLAPDNWTLLGRVRPYASLGPRAYTMTADPTGLSAPIRDTDTWSRGVGVGAGLNWRVTDRVDLFGEYHLLDMGGIAGPDGVLGRRDIDSPGLKGGLSIRF